MNAFERVLAEYRQMPGLRLTIAQAERLWVLGPDECEALLNALVATGQLYRDGKDQYALRRTVPEESNRRTLEAVA